MFPAIKRKPMPTNHVNLKSPLPIETLAWIEAKFLRLRDEWKQKRGPESSSTRLAHHPAYLKIIGMGPDVIPLLMRELEHDPDMWFVALRSITEADPVPAEIKGNVGAMAEAWLKWGQEQGYQW
jgi:hypothetical protein